MEILLNLIFEFVLSVIALVVSKHLIPWLKQKKLYGAAKIAVEAAEQLIAETGAGKKKYEQAKAWLASQFKLSDEEIEKLIESAVYNMKNKVQSE